MDKERSENMARERKLAYCSLSDKKKEFKWWEKNGHAWEMRSLKAVELADPALDEAYRRFASVIQGICWFRGEAQDIIDNIVIGSVAITYYDDDAPRSITIKGERYINSIGYVRICLPKIFENSSDNYFAERKLPQLIDELESECFKYIDGCRAQQSLEFEKAANEAEKAKEGTE